MKTFLVSQFKPSRKGVAATLVYTILYVLLFYFFLQQDLAAEPMWRLVVAVGVLGVGGYWLRTNFPGGYGLAEIVVGALLALLSTVDETTRETKIVFGVLAGVYVMIRGLDNMSRGWTSDRAKAIWDRAFGTTLSGSNLTSGVVLAPPALETAGYIAPARKKRWSWDIMKFLYANHGSEPRLVSKHEYEELLRDAKSAEKAFDKAWEIRNFEIELYWKRATYFWAFVASTFVGYFALIASDSYSKPDKYDHTEVYFLICLGFIVSLAWLLTNRGSKQWQKNWESHIDLLEDKFTGPLYKTVVPNLTFSVSKINELVSVAICLVWILLGAKFLLDADLLSPVRETQLVRPDLNGSHISTLSGDDLWLRAGAVWRTNGPDVWAISGVCFFNCTIVATRTNAQRCIGRATVAGAA